MESEKHGDIRQEDFPDIEKLEIGHDELNDTKDPLNWPSYKKHLMLLAICTSTYAGICGALANASGLLDQAKEYHTTPHHMSYSLSASLAGLAVGPFFWQPLANNYGKCISIFWPAVIMLACNIWGACMTGADKYGAFIGSRVVNGLASGAATTVGGRVILDLYRLEHRGKAFAVYTLSLLLGSLSGPLLSGYITYFVDWPVQYWYNVGLDVVAVILCFSFLEETSYPRGPDDQTGIVEGSWLRRRLVLIPGALNVHTKLTTQGWIDAFTTPWIILACPNGFLACFSLFVYFGFAAGTNNILAVLLQEPRKIGGFGLTSFQNSNFLWSQWAGMGIAFVYSALLNDRLPLWICKRHGGVWKPEYRLHTLWLPCVILFPIGYGCTGYGLHNHISPPALGVAGALTAGATFAVIPPLTTYLNECFIRRAGEANVMGGFSRLLLGIAFPFFVFEWEAKVGLIWLFGTMAFIHIATFSAVLILMVYGDSLRKLSWKSVGSSEAGLLLVGGGGH